MRKVDFHFQPSVEDIKSKIESLVSALEARDFDRELWRKRIQEDFKLNKIKTVETVETGFLAADSSITAKNLRYHALWGLHAVSLYGQYNGRLNEDPLVGQGSIPYANLMYDSKVSFGTFNPYWMLEQQMNQIRIAREYNILVDSYNSLSETDVKVDFILVDGSLKTNMENLATKIELKTLQPALQAQEKLLNTGKTISMVEDSHASEIARKLDLNMSNLMLFHLTLSEGEYVVDSGRINVCYIKLPGKTLSYSDRESNPITVRWEFPYENFQEDLNLLSTIWLKENDLLHPQIYPLRIADYLTRQIKTNGLLEEIMNEINPELEFRDMREAWFD